MASVLISSILKTTSDWLSLIQSTPSTSSTTTSTVADDLKKLKRMLKRIKAVLVDAAERQIVDQSVKLWLKEIEEMAYDAEDVLDEYQYQVLRSQVENRAIAAATATEAIMKMKGVEGVEEEASSASSDFNIAVIKISILNSMANKIKSIRKLFKEISMDRDRLHLKPEDGERRRDNSSEYPPPTTHMVIEQDIYGRDDDKEQLTDWLFSNPRSKFEVLAVVGKGGLGKTTLAQLVFNDQKVSHYFKTKMWICVSEDFNLIRLTRAMIENITEKSCTLSELSLLQESLKYRLQGKKVLLVLDNVWNENKGRWESLSIPLHGAEMVRIIVTTRNQLVAEIMQTTNPYRLGYLPEDQCWQLFLCRAFCGRDSEQFPYLVEIGKKIVKKCDGLPLAVKSLGSLLQYEAAEDKWNDVLQSKLWDNNTGIMPALMLSYIRMPSHLKPCFEICSMFPKDYLFRKDYLVKLWAAHGYIQRNNGEEINAVKGIGYTYFSELCRRSFFDEFDKHGKNVYKMHDHIHDLALYVQVGMDLNDHKIRHLSIENESLESYVDDVGALRTLIVLHEKKEALNDMLRRNITSLRNLRYLDITLHWSAEELLLPNGLRDLICLRHLELHIADSMKLPKSFCDLYNLVVLEITCDGSVEIPETLTNLVSLTTIYFCGFVVEHLPALGQLPSLKSLTVTQFKNMKSIGNELYRGWKNCNDAAFPSLTSLVLDDMCELEKWDEFEERDFPQLQKLEINGCGLPSLPSLGNLVLLLHISLNELWLDASLWLLSVSSFPPNLNTLESSCDLELRLPKGFGELKKLESLTGTYRVRIDDVFGILKNLASLKHLIVSNLENAHSAWNYETSPKEYSGIEKMVLDWFPCKFQNFLQRDNYLHLIVERDEDKNNDQFIHDDGNNQTKKTSFFVLERLQPRANLEELHILGYGGVVCPSWIGHPSFEKLNRVHLRRCKIDQLPTLGQLPSLEHLHLCSLDCLKIGSEFCRGNHSHTRVAFPSLMALIFEHMHRWKEWDGVQQGDFPKLEYLLIHDCPTLSSLYNCSRERLHLESLNGVLRVRNDGLFGTLNNLLWNITKLTITALRNVRSVMKAEACLKRQSQIVSLTLEWSTGITDDPSISSLLLVVEDDDDDDGTNQIQNASFFVLKKLQPYTNLMVLNVKGYDGVGYPSWIGHPSFNTLIRIRLSSCSNDQLPTLGQLPSLDSLCLDSISGLKRIGDEFCRVTTMMNYYHHISNVAFPSLRDLTFKHMHDWEEWYGVLNEGFPELQRLGIEDCPCLRKDLNSFPPRLFKYIYD